MGAGTSAEEFFLKSINVESIFEFVERTDYLFLYSIKECVEKSDCHEGVYLSEVAEYMKLSIPETSKMVKSLENKGYIIWKLGKEYTYLGFAEAVDERGYAQITQRNKFSVGETIEIMKPDGQNVAVTVKGIYDEEGNSMESAPHAQQKLFIDLGTEIQVYDLLRRAE